MEYTDKEVEEIVRLRLPRQTHWTDAMLDDLCTEFGWNISGYTHSKKIEASIGNRSVAEGADYSTSITFRLWSGGSFTIDHYFIYEDLFPDEG